ncbi:MAG: hypothetical protein ACKO2P_17995 [Planctomycetota bacterium]
MRWVRREVPGVSDRRGVISLWTAGVLGFFGFAGFCVISIRLDSARLQHARYATESAAIAAAHAWLADDLLRANPAAFETDGRQIRCRDAAESALSGYRTAGAPLIMGSADPEYFWNAGSAAAEPSAVPTAIRVSIPDVIPATSGGLAGLLTGQSLSAASTAAIENHPAALCPSPGSSIPFLPFAAVEDAAGSWTQLMDLQMGADAWSWNAESRQFEAGPDGIPEITVTLSSDGTTDSGPSLLALKLRSGVDAVGPLPSHAEIIRSGLTRQCLDGLSLTEFLYPSTFDSQTLTSVELSECLDAILAAPLEPRILSVSTSVAPVATPVAGLDPAMPPALDAVADPALAISPALVSSVTSVQLMRPLAVRVAGVTVTSASSAALTLQPCVLVSALIRSDRMAPASRSVYRVCLVE